MVTIIDYSRFRTLVEARRFVEELTGLSKEEAIKYLRNDIPKESYYQNKIMEYLKNLQKKHKNLYFWKAHQGAYTKRGIPDICLIVNGKYIGIEVKRPLLGEVSPIQSLAHRQIERAGGNVLVVSLVEELKEILESEIGNEHKKS